MLLAVFEKVRVVEVKEKEVVAVVGKATSKCSARAGGQGGGGAGMGKECNSASSELGHLKINCKL